MSIATGGSSLHGSSSSAEREVFNLSTSKGALALLRRVHAMAISPEGKNELRNAVFAAQSSAITTNQSAVTELFADYGVVVEFSTPNSALTNEEVSSLDVATPSHTVTAATESGSEISAEKSLSPVESPSHTRGFGRPAPSFSTPTNQEAKQPEPEDAVSEELQPSTAAAEQSATEMTRKIPVTPLPEDSVSKSVQAPIAEPAAAPPTAETETNSTVAVAASSEPAERIKAIKREVNALVGNPINLIDVNNEVGREYMNALLDAMKKINSGVGVADMERVMNRLENAFSAVKDTMSEQGPVAVETPVVANEPEEGNNGVHIGYAADNQPMSSEETTDIPTQLSDTEDMTAPQVTELDSSDVPTPESAVTPSVEPESDTIRTETETVNTSTSSKAVSSDSVAASYETPPSPQSVETEVEDTVATMRPVGSAIEAEIPSTASPDQPAAASSPFTAVAKEKQLKQLLEEKQHAAQSEHAALEAEIANDPLMASDVQAGLAQLLSEWKLFKSSGLFGTGPSGIDHPLYKKLAPLTMAAVLSGRFEDATPEIKQNITEYMSGWRYEEGITYEHGETFEHYLRRVIRHILDRQKNKVDKTA